MVCIEMKRRCRLGTSNKRGNFPQAPRTRFIGHSRWSDGIRIVKLQEKIGMLHAHMRLSVIPSA